MRPANLKIAAAFACGVGLGPTGFVGYHEFQWRFNQMQVRAKSKELAQFPKKSDDQNPLRNELGDAMIDYSMQAHYHYQKALMSKSCYGNFNAGLSRVFPENKN